MTSNAASIAEKLDQLLQDDTNFSTRSGLRFMTELVKDAFDYIASEQQRQKKDGEDRTLFENRVKGIETKLEEFLALRKDEQKKAEDDRTWYRRVVIGGIITIVLSETARWIFM